MPDTVTKRWTRSEVDEHAVANGCYFDEAKGAHVVEFFAKHLRHTIGRWAGQPFELMAWQRDEIIMPLFGWMDAEGHRRFRIAYIEVPKKQGKSSMAAGIGLYLLGGDGEAGSQVYCAASDRNQAGIVYREASAMAKASPLLRDYIIPRDSVKNLALPSSNSFLRVISSDAYTAEGLNIHGLIFDELHAQKTRELWDALRYGGAARHQPLLISITTAGYDRHSICYEQHRRVQQLLDGIIHDDTFFPYIRSAADDDDWTDPTVWRRANPALGVIISEKEMAQDCKEAQESPAKENVFKRYRLNIWTEQDVRWLSMEKWDACDAPVDPEALRGRTCYAGLDLATTTDLTAFVLLFPDDDGSYKLLPFFWAPEENARERSRRDRVPYLEWARQGLLSLTEGTVTDYAVMRRDINHLGDLYGIQEIAVDRVFQGAQLCTELADDGFTVTSFGQGFFAMAAPSAAFERLVLAGQLHHGGHPIMRWMAANVAVEQDAAGNHKPSKQRSAERIDGIVGGIMALGVATAAHDTGSVYDHRGILSI